MHSDALATRRFRANPRCDVVLFDRLPAEERARFAALAADADFYGVWCDPSGGSTAKAVTRDVALLLLTMRDAGALPRYFLDAIRGEELATVAPLVLDGLLEIEDGAGSFVSGPSAMAALGLSGAVAAPRDDARDLHPLAALSRAAVCYGAVLPIDDPIALSLRLYQFHRMPMDAAWGARLHAPAALLDWLGVGARGAAGRGLEQGYARVPTRAAQPRWQFWRNRTARLRGGTSHKLYLSPTPDAMPEVFRTAVAEFARHGVPAFKTGNDAGGVLRPDKFVAYFQGRQQLDDVAGALEDRLRGAPAHGVPFTAPVGAGTLLSWGMDPPTGGEVSPWRRSSWRLFVTDRLATALVAACRDGAGMAPDAFALERIAMEGIDVVRWCPAPGLWQEPRGAAHEA